MNVLNTKIVALNVSALVLTICLALFMSGCSTNKGPSSGNVLTFGKPVIDAIVNDEVHTYTSPLEAGHYIALAVEQRDVDVITKVFAPNGEMIGEFDTATSGRGTEKVRFGIDASGEYRIEISTLSAKAEPGEYKLEIAELRPITERDRTLLSTIKTHLEADRLRSKPETLAQSVPLYENALQTYIELGDKADIGNAHRAMGFAFQRQGDLATARDHFGKALAIWDETGDLRSAAFTHVIFGVMHKKENNLEAGLKEDLLAHKLWESSGDCIEHCQNLTRIAGDYVKLGRRDEAIANYTRAIEMSSNLPKKSIRAYVMMEYGDALRGFGNNEQALSMYEQSLSVWRTLNQEKVISDLEAKIKELRAN